MALTDLQKEIIYNMRERKATVDEAQGVILLSKSNSAQKDLVAYLRANPMATPLEIVEKAIEIRDLS